MNDTGSGSSAPATLVAVVKIPFGLYLQYDCLDDAYPITIDQTVASIKLPRVIIDGRGSRKIVAPNSVAQIRRAHNVEHWGEFYASNLRKATVIEPDEIRSEFLPPILIQRFLLEINLSDKGSSTRQSDVEAIASEVAENLEFTLETLKEWIEVAVSGPQLSSVTELTSLPLDSLKFLWFDGTRSRPVSHARKLVISGSDPGDGLTKGEWMSILHAASRKVRPPIPSVYLRNALACLMRQDTRMAVLNSATAAEIALSEMLDAKLLGLPASIATIVVNATQGLSRLSSTLSKRFDVELPAGINQKLGQPRNRAIHSGEDLSFQTAAEAFEIAAAIVETAHPMEDLLGHYRQ